MFFLPIANTKILHLTLSSDLQNKKIKDVTDFEQRLKKEIKSGSKSLLLTIVDSQNRSRYVGVKIK